MPINIISSVVWTQNTINDMPTYKHCALKGNNALHLLLFLNVMSIMYCLLLHYVTHYITRYLRYIYNSVHTALVVCDIRMFQYDITMIIG